MVGSGCLTKVGQELTVLTKVGQELTVLTKEGQEPTGASLYRDDLLNIHNNLKELDFTALSRIAYLYRANR